MAILLNSNQTETNLSGENLLASSSLENSINEARNLAIVLDQKSADLKNKIDEFKQESDVTLTEVFAKMDAKETAFATSINGSATKASGNIAKAVNDLKQASSLAKNIWVAPQAIAIHVILFLIEIGIVFFVAVPPIIEAKKSLNDNEKLLKNLREIKQENERLCKENEQLTADNKDMDSFILFLHGGDMSKAQKGFRLWLKAKK